MLGRVHTWAVQTDPDGLIWTVKLRVCLRWTQTDLGEEKRQGGVCRQGPDMEPSRLAYGGGETQSSEAPDVSPGGPSLQLSPRLPTLAHVAADVSHFCSNRSTSGSSGLSSPSRSALGGPHEGGGLLQAEAWGDSGWPSEWTGGTVIETLEDHAVEAFRFPARRSRGNCGSKRFGVTLLRPRRLVECRLGNSRPPP